MLGHELVDEITTDYTHNGLKITVSYIGNTALIRKAKKKPGRIIYYNIKISFPFE
jgi:hypothetical protein